jgi:hypothetical protein
MHGRKIKCFFLFLCADGFDAYTKGTESLFNLKTPEQLKIHCGKEHFKALGNGLEMYGPVKDWDKFKVNE